MKRLQLIFLLPCISLVGCVHQRWFSNIEPPAIHDDIIVATLIRPTNITGRQSIFYRNAHQLHLLIIQCDSKYKSLEIESGAYVFKGKRRQLVQNDEPSIPFVSDEADLFDFSYDLSTANVESALYVSRPFYLTPKKERFLQLEITLKLLGDNEEKRLLVQEAFRPVIHREINPMLVARVETFYLSRADGSGFISH